MPSTELQAFRRSLAAITVISLVAWVAFATFFRSAWPGPTAPDEALGLVFAWLAVGGGAFVAAALGVFRWLRTPPAGRAAAAAALSAPALCPAVFTTLFFESRADGTDKRTFHRSASLPS